METQDVKIVDEISLATDVHSLTNWRLEVGVPNVGEAAILHTDANDVRCLGLFKNCLMFSLLLPGRKPKIFIAIFPCGALELGASSPHVTPNPTSIELDPSWMNIGYGLSRGTITRPRMLNRRDWMDGRRGVLGYRLNTPLETGVGG